MVKPMLLHGDIPLGYFWWILQPGGKHGGVDLRRCPDTKTGGIVIEAWAVLALSLSR